MTRADDLQAASAKGVRMTHKDEADLLDAIPDLLAVVRAAQAMCVALTGKPWAMVPGAADDLAAALAAFEEGGKDA